MIKDLFKDAWPIIETAAPSLARVFGGAPVMAINFLLPLIYKAFNVEAGNLPQLINSILNNTDASVKLESIEHEHGDWMCSMLDSIGQLESLEFSVKINWKK